jgi:MFS family permease
MDTMGAVVGPILALIFLYVYPGQYKTLFYVAFFPGMIAICLTLLIKDRKPVTKENVIKTNFFDFIKYWKHSPPAYRKLVVGLLLFTLFNSSDVFLLLKIRDAGYSDSTTIELYIFYNIVYAAFAFPIGILADRIGLKSVFVFGLSLFAIVYIGMAVNSNLYVFFLLFFLYGIYAAATEGIAKGWISNISSPNDTATAIGTFAGLQSICTMVASSIAGLLWIKYGASIAFAATSVVTFLVIAYLLTIKKAACT